MQKDNALKLGYEDHHPATRFSGNGHLMPPSTCDDRYGCWQVGVGLIATSAEPFSNRIEPQKKKHQVLPQDSTGIYSKKDRWRRIRTPHPPTRPLFRIYRECSPIRYGRRESTMTIRTSVTIGDVTLSEEELQDGFSAETIFSTPGSRGE